MKRTPLRAVSRKRQQANRLRRKAMVERFGTRPLCQARWDERCAGWADDAHEILSRARGGSITDPDNVIPVCRPCHRALTENPVEAERRGLSAPPWGGDAA